MADDHAMQLGQVIGRLDGINDRLDKIDQRLDDGDKRFESIAAAKAARDVERKIAVKVGGWVLGAAAAVGGATITAAAAYAPAIAAWLVPPKH